MCVCVVWRVYGVCVCGYGCVWCVGVCVGMGVYGVCVWRVYSECGYVSVCGMWLVCVW